MPPSKVLIAGNAAIASEHPLTSLAGYDILKSGGNAFDAAVATSFVLAVTQHQIGGLGGDFFGMFFEAKSGKIHCLNSSGWAPSGLNLDLVKSKGEPAMPIYGPLSCVVPGQVAGVSAMHDKFGSLEFGSLLGAASSYALDGFPAGEGLCRSIAGALDHFSPEARRVFAPLGRAPAPGDWIRQENLAKVIGEIAEGGTEAFYGGWPADRVRETLQGLGVPSESADFTDFKPEWVDPLALDYHGTRVYEMPPNSMGATTLLMLKLLSEKSLSSAGPLSKLRVDLTMEAADAAYSRKDKMLGDPRFSRIDMDQFMSPSAPGGTYAGQVRDGDTTAFSIADHEGNLVSAIQSLFRHFGSRVFVPACGIMLNSRASGFRTDGPNAVEPRKRPLHTLSSMILEREEGHRFAIGTSGGDYRPLQHAQFVTDIVDYGMPLEQAVGHPRFVWSEGRDLVVEEGFQELASSKYDVQKVPGQGRTGVCQAVEILGRTRRAVCDTRGDGIPAGF
ncbi:MAG TPA: gamma-glutamyltransferase family protein [Nitrososphaerales archaeon]|nr:gamma-glutamyltransferase family protein [Nitrososphaerales archaeon]